MAGRSPPLPEAAPSGGRVGEPLATGELEGGRLVGVPLSGDAEPNPPRIDAGIVEIGEDTGPDDDTGLDEDAGLDEADPRRGASDEGLGGAWTGRLGAALPTRLGGGAPALLWTELPSRGGDELGASLTGFDAAAGCGGATIGEGGMVSGQAIGSEISADRHRGHSSGLPERSMGILPGTATRAPLKKPLAALTGPGRAERYRANPWDPKSRPSPGVDRRSPSSSVRSAGHPGGSSPSGLRPSASRQRPSRLTPSRPSRLPPRPLLRNALRPTGSDPTAFAPKASRSPTRRRRTRWTSRTR
jgi:hypothetical protein